MDRKKRMKEVGRGKKKETEREGRGKGIWR